MILVAELGSLSIYEEIENKIRRQTDHLIIIMKIVTTFYNCHYSIRGVSTSYS